MVLTIKINDKYIEIGNSEVIELSGIDNIDIDENLKINCDKLKQKMIDVIKNKSNEINFNNKKIYNHIKFYDFFGIKLDIKLDKIKSSFRTNIYYKNTLIHSCKKTIEPYFNYLILESMKKNSEFDYLFHKDNGFFNENKIIIDMMDINSKSNERFDMKIYFEKNNKSFGLECFEKHHVSKFDYDHRNEISRILNKNYFESDIRFTVIFWYDDIIDINKFNNKFNKFVKNNFKIHNRTKKEYCVDNLNTCINNKELCENIYESYINKLNPIININEINKLFQFKKNGKKEYLKYFKTNLKNMYLEEKKNDNDILFISNSDYDSDSDSNSGLIDDHISEDEYLSKYFFEDKLTFKGFGRYVIGLSSSDKYLKFNLERDRILDWYDNILSLLIDSFEKAYNDLDKLFYEKNIFGLVDKN